MNLLFKGLIVASALGAGYCLHDWAGGPQDAKAQDDKAAAMPMPKPTEEHKWLAEGCGTWKTVGKMHQPDGSTTPMSGVHTITMQQGGFWQISDYKDDNGQFVGHGVTGWDPYKKKFMGIWVDSMGPEFNPLEGTLSDDKKTITMTFSCTDPQSGKKIQASEKFVRTGDKTGRFEMSMQGPDGKWMTVIELDYTKK